MEAPSILSVTKVVLLAAPLRRIPGAPTIRCAEAKWVKPGLGLDEEKSK